MITNHLICKKFYFLLILSGLFFFGNSQTNNDSKLFEAYKNYTKLPREIAFAHVNKSTLIVGESLGFSVYVFDKYTKKSSAVTTNVYCSIEDRTGKTLKSKMILARDGVASGIFEIDSVFKSRNYKFIVYTNWMKNFDEHNFYAQSLKIINPDDVDESEDDEEEDYFDLEAQFLPEGGHLLLDVKNTVGVVIKDDYGFGVANIKGVVSDSNRNEITNFETNMFGIAKFEFTPERQTIYSVTLNDDDETRIVLDTAELRGITMSLSDLEDKVAIIFKTNSETLPSIANETYKLSISNGYELSVVDVVFGVNSEIKTIIDDKDLFTGVNIITLFDKNDTPILERLYFKYDGIDTIKSDVPKLTQVNDSLVVKIPISALKKDQFHNLSISVLPSATKSYNHHHNILSYTFLKPYLRGKIENARYYFTDVDKKKLYDLDNLLLTQGWSSYDWNTIFNGNQAQSHEFENGITVNVNRNNTKGNKFLIYPLQYSPTFTLDVLESENIFPIKGLLPVKDESFKIGTINNQNRVDKPNLYLQFLPYEIPDLNKKISTLNYKKLKAFKYQESPQILDGSWNQIEELDTILLAFRKKEERIEKLQRSNRGRVFMFTDDQRQNIPDFATYIASKGFTAKWIYPPGDPPQLVIESGRSRATAMGDPSISSSLSPVIYLDQMRIEDFNFLSTVDMSSVDYIIIDKQGYGEGIRGGNGVIKIITNPLLRTKNYYVNRDVGQSIKFPLTFSENKKFYTPVYSSYQTDFFRSYGVIDWFDRCQVDDDGQLSIKIKNTNTKELKLLIEGIANNGAFISEEKIIQLNP